MNDQPREPDAVDVLVDQFINNLTAHQPILKDALVDAHLRKHAEELKTKIREHIANA